MKLQLLLRFSVVCACGVILNLFPVGPIQAHPLENWTRRSPLPDGNELGDIAFGNGVFVAVAYGGNIMTSSNGTTWALQYRPGKPHMYDIAFGNGRFVAVQAVPNPGTNLVSTDGVSWIEAKAPIRFEGIGFGNGLFVGGGYTGSEFVTYSSADGIVWTRRGTLPGNVTQIIYGNSQYLACGYTGRFYSSTNLDEWSVHDTGTGFECYGLCYGNGQYVSVGRFPGVLVSTNGADWVHIATEGNGHFDVVYANGQFAGVGTHSVSLNSPNGINWSAGMIPYQPGVPNSYNAMAFGNGRYVAVGTRGAVAVSTNGIDWTLESRGTILHLFSVTYTGEQWAAAGWLQLVITSSNGIDWNTTRYDQPFWYSEINYANGFYHASLGVVVHASTNGTNWTESLLPVEPGEDAVINGYTYGSGRWVGAGIGGNVWTSEDGYGWTRRQSGVSLDLNAVIYTNDQFVVVGTQGQIVTSGDGISWTPRTSGTTTHLNAIAYGHGLYLAVGVGGKVLRSRDGVNWTNGYAGLPAVLTDATFGSGYFVAVGGGGIIISSPNGIDWTRQSSPTDFSLFSVAFGDNSFVAVGEGGVIVQSDPILHLELSRTPLPIVSLAGPRRRWVRIEQTSDPAVANSWQPAAVLQLDKIPRLWSDPDGFDQQRRFYRGVLLP